jgi:hypothetical protein
MEDLTDVVHCVLDGTDPLGGPVYLPPQAHARRSGGFEVVGTRVGPLGPGTQWHYWAWLGAQGLGMPPRTGTRPRPQPQGSLLAPNPGILNRL